MKKIFFAFFVCVIFYKPGFAQTENNQSKISIIPQPVSVNLQEGNFSLKPETANISADKSASDVASFLSALLHENYGFNGKNNGEKNGSSKASFSLAINKSENKSIGGEGYTLKVTPQTVLLSANTSKGLFYGMQTLTQLLPAKSNGYAQHPVKFQQCLVLD